MKRPLHTRTDESIADRAATLAATYPELDGRADDVHAALVATVPTDAHDTKRTSTAPERTYAPRVTSTDRRKQFGGADSEVATYPILDGAPVGNVGNLAQAQREYNAACDAAAWARKVAEEDARIANAAKRRARGKR